MESPQELPTASDDPTRIPRPDRRRRTAIAVALESGGVVWAVVVAMVSVLHLVSTDRIRFLYFDGDSIVGPLFAQSFQWGEPIHWVMSPVLFIPELIAFLPIAALTPTPIAALTVVAIANALLLYWLFRWSAGLAARDRSRAVRVGLAAVTMTLFGGFVLLEPQFLGNSFQVFSMNLSNTHYIAAVAGTIATMNIVAGWLVATTGSRRRRIAGASTRWLALAIITTILMLSCPLYGVWAIVPTVGTLGLMALLRRIGWGVPLIVTSAFIVGSAIGTALRLGPFAWALGTTGDAYWKLLQVRHSLASYAIAARDTAAVPTGVIELVGITVLVAVTIAAAVLALRRRATGIRLYLPLLASATAIGVTTGAILTGQDATRYLIVCALVPLAVLPSVLIELRPGLLERRPRRPRLVAAVAAAVVAVSAVVIVPVTTTTVAGIRNTVPDCLNAWIGDRDGLVGAGDFWAVRELQVYGSDRVSLLQLLPWLDAYPWMTDLEPFRGAEPTYLVLSDRLRNDQMVTARIGEPAEVVLCDGYQIWDYAGTAGEAELGRIVRETGEAALAGRGW